MGLQPVSNTHVLVFALLTLGALSMVSCVKTADCDENIKCQSGEVCYRKFCYATCEIDEDCLREDDQCLCVAGECKGGDGANQSICLDPTVCKPACQADEICENGGCAVLTDLVP